MIVMRDTLSETMHNQFDTQQHVHNSYVQHDTQPTYVNIAVECECHTHA